MNFQAMSVNMSIAALNHYWRRSILTNQELTDDEIKEMALKRLKELSEILRQKISKLKALPKSKNNGLIKNYLMIRLNLSYDEWRYKLAEKYDSLDR